ncbi:MAG: hypothetical protein J6T59_05320 [Bacteroidales bacterium]|nr:hypothetical protein [Bacteroidales bacterium]
MPATGRPQARNLKKRSTPSQCPTANRPRRRHSARAASGTSRPSARVIRKRPLAHRVVPPQASSLPDPTTLTLNYDLDFGR